jgi:hypothetical protein
MSYQTQTQRLSSDEIEVVLWAREYATNTDKALTNEKAKTASCCVVASLAREVDKELSELCARAQCDDPQFCHPSEKSVKRTPLHMVRKSQGFQSAEGWRCGCINWECGDYWCAARFDSKNN